MDEKPDLYFDEPTVVSFAISEFGWFLQYMQGYLRYLKHKVYPNHKFILFSSTQYHVLVKDFISHTIQLPPWFGELGLEPDCYESVLPGSPPGSLTPPDVYASLLQYFRQFYDTSKAVEIWPPRGYSTFLMNKPQVFTRYSSTENIREQFDKPIIVVFPRARARAPQRNIPEYIWREFVLRLSQNRIVVTAGIPGGACLEDLEGKNIINMIKYEGEDKLDKIMEYLCNAELCVSSQSGPTHLSLLCACPSYIIGHEEQRHCVKENRLKTFCTFRYVQDYRCTDSDTMLNDMDEFIARLRLEQINRPSLNVLKDKKGLVGVEIGTSYGMNAMSMLKNLDIEKLYLVDPYEIYDELEKVKGTQTQEFHNSTYELMLKNLEPYMGRVQIIKEYSENAVSEIENGLDFAYIDGNHSYEYVKRDLELYYPKVKKGGLVAGHDYNDPIFINEDGSDKIECEINHVKKAVDEFFNELGLDIQSDTCLDDLGNHDWWVIKPVDYNDIVAADIDTMNKLIPKDENDIEIFVDKEK